MILFFDRNIGTGIPKALQLLRMRDSEIQYHQAFFSMATEDDRWLERVGEWGWIVIGQDYKFHLLPNELYSIKQHSVGAFYLAGAELPAWETMRIFARAYDKIIDAVERTSLPFVFWIDRNGRLTQLSLP